MAETTNQNIARDKRVPQTHESHLRSASARVSTTDDVIASLANAPENRRARQVNEWERVGYRGIYRVA